jgi:TldD protein
LWLTIHESIGHPTELDRAMGFEANFAGTSFLSPPEKVLNKFKYGPAFMTILGNRTEPGGCSTCGWDDEGVPAQSWAIVDKGIVVNYQTTREMASWISNFTKIRESLGTAYGQDWASIPFPRMPNVSLQPNTQDLSEQDVIGATKRGIYIEGDGSYSIDQQRYNFQFGGQVFWEIKDGKRTRMLRDVAYQARTPDFWNSMALLGGKSTYKLGGALNDGKGQPQQLNAVSHGCPIALFRNVNVINTA